MAALAKHMRATWLALLFAMTSAYPGFADGVLISDLNWSVLDKNEVGPALFAPKEQTNLYSQESEAYWQFELGRIAFRTPALLGGLAAREGMSCHSCHQSGGTNRHFFVDGLSSKPGTFDPTNALFSTHTDDGIDNPVPIPTLYNVTNTAPYPSDGRFPSLDQMVTHVIEEEFDGLSPPHRVSQGLLTYLSTLRKPASDQQQAISPLTDLDDIRRMLGVMARAIDDEDVDVFEFVANATRRKLGTIHNRYFNAEDIGERLLRWSTGIKKAREFVAADRSSDASVELEKIEKSLNRSDDFNAGMAASLYDQTTLSEYIKSLDREPQ